MTKSYKLKFYIAGIDVKRMISLVKCIEENKLTRVSDIVRTCSISWGLLYKYLLFAYEHDLIDVEFIKTRASMVKARGIRVKVKPKFYELVKIITDIEKLLGEE